MKLPTLDLRAKIFFGGALLIVPLALTLAYLTAEYNGQIAVAQKEELGRQATDPLINALIHWVREGDQGAPSTQATDALNAYVAAVKAHPEALGPLWGGKPGPEAAYAAGAPGDTQKFAEVSEALTAELARLGDVTGIVLDPDLDSYYAVLAVYQGIPESLNQAAALRALARENSKSLSKQAVVDLAVASDALGSSAKEIQGWVAHSVSALPQAYVPVPGYAEAAQAKTQALAATGDSILTSGSAMASGEQAWNPAGLETPLNQYLTDLDPLHDVLSPALGVMLHGRINALAGRLFWAWGSAFVGLALATAVFLWLGTSVRRRSASLVASLEKMAEGDLTHPVDAFTTRSGDELGRLGRAVGRVRDDMAAAIRAVAQVNETLAALGNGLAATAEESASAIEEMSAAAAQVSKVADNQQSQTDGASQDVHDMVARVNESNELTQGMAGQFFLFSQAMEANRRRIQTTSNEAQNTGRLAENLDRTGEEGQRSLEALRTAIGGVVRQTQEIQEIVRFILDIADRTNLLSMNAGIEAAHAGNLGRGFKVVADEIRKLAETSGTQAQNIRALVDGIAASAATTLERSEATDAAFGRLRTDIDAVKNAAQAIAGQIAQQEAEDTKLTEGLTEFTRFYSDLSGTLDVQVTQSEAILTVMGHLADGSRQISVSTGEQRIGMGQATDAVVQMRDTAMDVARILDELNGLVARFRVE